MKVVKLGIISDTHDLNSFYLALPKIKRFFGGCDYIVHAGDIVNSEVPKELSKIAPVKAVLGNQGSDARQFSFLPRTITLSVGNIKIGVVHGLGNNPERIFNIILGWLSLGRLGMKIYFRRVSRFFSKDTNCIIFGDLHHPICRRVEDKLFLNPGSTDGTERGEGTIGILQIKDNKIFSKTIYL